MIRQIVPPEWCRSCDVCCHFPEEDSFLRPYFTREEIERATDAGMDAGCFHNPNGGKISLCRAGDGFLCPCYDPGESRCRIYTVRPLDCIIYPFALMWGREGKRVILGVDTKCPYIQIVVPELTSRLIEDARLVGCSIESPPILSIISENPALIGPFQEDVIPLHTLHRLTSKLKGP